MEELSSPVVGYMSSRHPHPILKNFLTHTYKNGGWGDNKSKQRKKTKFYLKCDNLSRIETLKPNLIFSGTLPRKL